MRTLCAVAGLLGAVVCGACNQPGSPAGPAPATISGLSSGSAVAQSRPFRGTLEGTQRVIPSEPPLATVDGEATGTATLLGRFTVRFPHEVDFSTATGKGTFTFTAANGDMLTADFEGKAQQGPIVSIVEEAEITGGTGRFAGASGSFTVQRQFNPATGVTTGSFTGTISAPGAGR